MDTAFLGSNSYYIYSIAIEVFISIGYFIYYWSIGKREKAYTTFFQMIIYMFITFLILYLLINDYFQRYMYCNMVVCQKQNQELAENLIKIEKNTIIIYNSLIRATYSIIIQDILFSVSAVFMSPTISLLILEYFPLLSNSVISILMLGIRSIGYVILIIVAIRKFLSFVNDFSPYIFSLGLTILPIRKLRKIGMSFIILSFSLGYIFPYFLSGILNNINIPDISFANETGYEKVGYVNFSIIYTSGKAFPLANIIIQRNMTLDKRNISEIYIIPYVDIYKRKTIILPTGRYQIKGILLYWSFFPICSKENCPPSFTTKEPIFEIKERQFVNISIEVWRLYYLPCNNSYERGCGGLVFGIYKNKKSFSYIRFQENGSSLFYKTILYPGQDVEIFTLGAKPVLIFNKTYTKYIKFKISYIKYFSNSDISTGKKITRDAIIEFNKWRLRNKIFSFNNITINNKMLVKSLENIRKIKKLNYYHVKVSKWKLSVKTIKEARDPVNITINIIPMKECWNYTYLTYSSRWSYIDSLGSSFINSILKIWEIVILIYSSLVRMFASIIAINIVMQRLTGVLFTNFLIIKIRRHITFPSFKSRLLNFFKKLEKIHLKIIKDTKIAKIQKTTSYLKNIDTYIKNQIRKRIVDKFRLLTKIELYKKSLMYRVYPYLKYFDEENYLKIAKKLDKENLIKKAERDLSLIENKKRLLKFYYSFIKKFPKIDKNTFALKFLEPVSGSDLEKLFDYVKKIYIEGLREDRENYFILYENIVKIDKLINSFEKINRKCKVIDVLKKIYITRIFLLYGLLELDDFKKTEEKYIYEVKKVLRSFPPYKFLALLKILDDRILQKIYDENIGSISMLIERNWIRDLYIIYTYIYDVLPKYDREKLSLLFQGVNIYDLDKYYSEILFYTRKIVKNLREKINRKQISLNEYYNSLTHILREMESSLFYYPYWFQEDDSKLDVVIEKFIDRYINIHEPLEEIIREKNRKIDKSLLLEFFLNNKHRINVDEIHFMLSHIHELRKVKNLEETLHKKIREYEDTFSVDEKKEIKNEILKIIEKLEKKLLRLVIECEKENINSSYYRKKMNKIHVFYLEIHEENLDG